MAGPHVAGMGDARNSGQRPAGLTPPAHLSPSPPVPEPGPPADEPDPKGDLSPTRYGDWERKGIAIDF